MVKGQDQAWNGSAVDRGIVDILMEERDLWSKGREEYYTVKNTLNHRRDKEQIHNVYRGVTIV